MACSDGATNLGTQCLSGSVWMAQVVCLVFSIDKADGVAMANSTDFHVLCICESAKLSYEGDDLARPRDPE